MVSIESLRVRLIGFGASSYDIEVYAHVKTIYHHEFLAIREDIFLQLIDIVDESGTGFAFPSTVNYLARDSGVDPKRTEKSEEIMRQLREDGKLAFPDFDMETEEALKDTLAYPPEGSIKTKDP